MKYLRKYRSPDNDYNSLRGYEIDCLCCYNKYIDQTGAVLEVNAAVDGWALKTVQYANKDYTVGLCPKCSKDLKFPGYVNAVAREGQIRVYDNTGSAIIPKKLIPLEDWLGGEEEEEIEITTTGAEGVLDPIEQVRQYIKPRQEGKTKYKFIASEIYKGAERLLDNASLEVQVSELLTNFEDCDKIPDSTQYNLTTDWGTMRKLKEILK